MRRTYLAFLLLECHRLYRRTAAQNNGRVTPEVRLVMGEVGAICVPVGQSARSRLPLLCSIASILTFFKFIRPFLAGIHHIPWHPLDSPHHRLRSLRRRYLLCLHLDIHVPRHGVPSHSRERDGVEQRHALDVRCGVSTFCTGDVCEAWDGRRDGTPSGVDDGVGTLPVSAFLSFVTQFSSNFYG